MRITAIEIYVANYATKIYLISLHILYPICIEHFTACHFENDS